MASQVNPPGLIRFGPFALDPDSRELRRRGYLVRLHPQQCAVLLLLIERAGQIVSREEIHQHIWGNDTFVDFERGINFSINQIRAALGDDADKPRFIETIPRRGYRFIAAIENDEPRTADASASGTPMPGDRTATANGDQDQVNSSSDVNPALTAAPARPYFAKRILIGLSLLAIIAAGLMGYRALSHGARHTAQSPARSGFPNMRITQLTSLPGVYWHPIFSPDGKQFAYFWRGNNRDPGDLYVQLVGGEKPLRLTHNSTDGICCSDWSPDGQHIVFGRSNDNGCGVFIIPALGGPEHKLTEVACNTEGAAGSAQWTADGRSLVLVDRCTPDAPVGIVVFSLQTGEKLCLHSPPTGDVGDNSPALSPDQKTVAFLRQPTAGLGKIYTVAFSGGNLRSLTNASFDTLDNLLMWSADGKYLAFPSEQGRVARIAASGGPVEFESVYPRMGELSRDGRRLVYVDPSPDWRFSMTIWRVEFSHAGGKVLSQTRILGSTARNDSVQLSPDEQQLAFHSFRYGTQQIWRTNVDGTDPLQLTSFEHGYPDSPRWSPSGKWIAFNYHTAAAHGQIYLVDSEGRNLHALTAGNYENSVPGWSRDGKALYFASNRSGDWQVWRREISTGKETRITQHGGFAAFESYDGKTLYYSRKDRGGVWKMPVGGGQEDLVTNSLHRGDVFALTANGLYLVGSDAKGDPAIMYYDFQARRPSSVPTKQLPLDLAASRDGRMLFYVQGEFVNCIISMAENFQ